MGCLIAKRSVSRVFRGTVRARQIVKGRGRCCMDGLSQSSHHGIWMVQRTSALRPNVGVSFRQARFAQAVRQMLPVFEAHQ